MSFKILISDEARFDVIDAFIWYETQREGLGFDFELCVEAGLNFIERNPQTVQIRYDDVRVYFIERFPYGIHFILEENVVRVYAVFHSSRNPEDWTKRQ